MTGFDFAASHSADGTRITIVASKDDHECKKTESFTMSPEVATMLSETIRSACRDAKNRRKAERKAEREASPDTKVQP